MYQANTQGKRKSWHGNTVIINVNLMHNNKTMIKKLICYKNGESELVMQKPE